MATALDVIGDRWTPLLLRELLGGPARFNDLLDGLPGIAKNLLASRLRRLEADGIVRKTSAQSAVLYALTEKGGEIRPVLEQLAFWGASLKRVGPAEHDRSVRAIAMALQAIFARGAERLAANPCVVELEVDDEPIEIRLGSRPKATARTSADPDARVRVKASTMRDFFRGKAVEARRFALLSGDEAARTALLDALGIQA